MINQHFNQNSSQMVLMNSMKKDSNFGLLFNGFVFGKKNERINWRKIGILAIYFMKNSMKIL